MSSSLENTTQTIPSSTNLTSNIPVIQRAGPPPAEEIPGQPLNDGVITDEMDCPHSKVGVVIGSKGIIIQEIMQRTNCKIVVMQEGLPDGQPRKVNITGLPHQIQLAKQLISSVIADGPSAIQSPGIEFDPSDNSVETQEMICPAEKVGLVIGSRGVIVQDIMRRTGCKITVNQNYPEGEPRVVVITGHPPNIEFAKSLVALVIANGPAALNQSGVGMNIPGYVTEEMDCPHERVGIVIGAKGTIVQDIMRRSGSRIVVNQEFPDGYPRKVVISGMPHQVRHAKHLVMSVIMHGPVAVQGQPMVNPVMSYGGHVMQDLKIVQSQVGKLIGPGGSTIKDLQLRFAVKMNIDQLAPDTEERRLRITGEPARVQAASQMIWHLLHNNSPINVLANQGQTGYGMQVIGEGYSDVGMNNGYYPPQSSQNHPNAESGLHPAHAPIGQGLGADGTAGRLMPPTLLSNGLLHQVVFVLKGLMPRLLGPNNSVMYLIILKSGATVDIDSATVVASGGQEMTKINIVGPSSVVTLAGQMIQEVLINGPDKLSSLPDAPQQGLGYEHPNAQQPPGDQRHGRGDGYGFHQPQHSRQPTHTAGGPQSYPQPNYGGGHPPNGVHEQQNQYPTVYSNREQYSREHAPTHGGNPQHGQFLSQQQPQYPGSNYGAMLPHAQYQQSTGVDPSNRPLISNQN